MTPQEFVAKWKPVKLSERSAAQQHFLDLCELLGQPKPAAADPEGGWYTFERGVRKTGGGQGWADVWMKEHFAWEYKKKHKDLEAAYSQLLQYREDLENPPLLVVCDLNRFEIHTNFTNTAKTVHAFDLDNFDDPANLMLLRNLFSNCEAMKPKRTTKEVTEEIAARFAGLADGMRARSVPAQQAAHFLMKLMFCMFAEDIRLLPEKLFSKVLAGAKRDPALLARKLKSLFEAMAHGGDFGADIIDHFNGGLFADAEVIPLTPEEIEELVRANDCDWSNVAVIEVKSNLISQWTEMTEKVRPVKELKRRWRASMHFETFSGGVRSSEDAFAIGATIPCIAVGYKGHMTLGGLQDRLETTMGKYRPDGVHRSGPNSARNFRRVRSSLRSGVAPTIAE